MNRFAQELARNVGVDHLSLSQKCHDVIMQIFGHEGLIEVSDSVSFRNSHCPMFNEDIYRIRKLKWEHLTYRKLLNPFKWLEFLLAFPLEMLSFLCFHPFEPSEQSSEKKPNVLPQGAIDKTPRKEPTRAEKCLLKFKECALRCGEILLEVVWILVAISVYCVTHIALDLVRLFLAPVRSIVRPFIELARKDPYQLVGILSFALLLSMLLIPFVLTGGVSVPLGLALASTLATKIAAYIVITLLVWKSLSQFVDMGKAVITLKMEKEREGIKVKREGITEPEYHLNQWLSRFNENASTAKITEVLHGLDPKTTPILAPKQQSCVYRVLLFWGLESFSKEPKSHTEQITYSRKYPPDGKIISDPYDDLYEYRPKDYQNKQGWEWVPAYEQWIKQESYERL